jgi:hypothetical protein
MKKISLLLLVTTSLLITACAGKPKVGDDGVAMSADTVCRYEKTTGSKIGTKICRTPAQMEYEKKVAQEAMRKMRTGAIVGSEG